MILKPRKIRSIRQQLALSRKDFGEMLGVNESAVGHWERGIRTPSRTAQILLERVAEKIEKK